MWRVQGVGVKAAPVGGDAGAASITIETTAPDGTHHCVTHPYARFKLLEGALKQRCPLCVVPGLPAPTPVLRYGDEPFPRKLERRTKLFLTRVLNHVVGDIADVARTFVTRPEWRGGPRAGAEMAGPSESGGRFAFLKRMATVVRQDVAQLTSDGLIPPPSLRDVHDEEEYSHACGVCVELDRGLRLVAVALADRLRISVSFDRKK